MFSVHTHMMFASEDLAQTKRSGACRQAVFRLDTFLSLTPQLYPCKQAGLHEVEGVCVPCGLGEFKLSVWAHTQSLLHLHPRFIWSPHLNQTHEIRLVELSLVQA